MEQEDLAELGLSTAVGHPILVVVSNSSLSAGGSAGLVIRACFLSVVSGGCERSPCEKAVELSYYSRKE